MDERILGEDVQEGRPKPAALNEEERAECERFYSLALRLGRKFNADEEYQSVAAAALCDAMLQWRAVASTHTDKSKFLKRFILHRLAAYRKRELRHATEPFNLDELDGLTAKSPDDEVLAHVRHVIARRIGDKATQKQVAELLGVHRNTLRNRRHKGK